MALVLLGPLLALVEEPGPLQGHVLALVEEPGPLQGHVMALVEEPGPLLQGRYWPWFFTKARRASLR